MADINEAASALQRLVDLTPTSDAYLPNRLSNLGLALTGRFERTGDLSDISNAISQLQKAIMLTPEGHSELPGYLTNIGSAFTSRFERTGDLSDNTQAISAQRKAVDATPQGHDDLPTLLSNLCISLHQRFQRDRELSDNTEAVSMQKRAVELAGVGHPNLAAYLCNLGNMFMSRFEWTGELSDISEAVVAQQKAIALIPDGHGAIPILLRNLGNSFSRRFERTGDVSDITEAISAQRRAVDLTPQGDVELPGRLDSLSGALSRRFERTGELSDISEAISAQQKAIALAPQDHAYLPSLLTNLGVCLNHRFERTGNLSDITEAISAQQRGVDIAPPGHANLPSWLNNLGVSLYRRSKATGDMSDIDDAISTQQRAADVASLSGGHAAIPSILVSLGTSIEVRFERTGDVNDLNECISHYKAASISSLGSPQIRLGAAKDWAHSLTRYSPQSPEIITAFDIALSLVALIAGLEQTVRGRYTQLQGSSGLALEAAAAACTLGRVDKALEWLEQGRCLVWSQINNLRTPLDDLRLHDQDLAQRIADVSKRLENAGSSRAQSNISMSTTEKISLEDEGRAHLDLAKEWEGLLGTVRATPGFESFLRPPPCAFLMQHLPESGVIVVINVDKRRCDAIALRAGWDEPLHIPLPNFSTEKAIQYRVDLTSRLRARNLRVREAGESTLRDIEVSDSEVAPRGIWSAFAEKRGEDPLVHRVLRGLWEEVIKPILEALKLLKVDKSSESTPPRLWWCPTGPLSFLPLHAAGVYRGANPECVFDYVVSSYTPTVTAMNDRVKNRRPIDAETSGLFLTNQPNAPGASPISGTTKEVRAISEKARESQIRMEKLEGSDMTVNACLEHMQKFSSIHLACHGSQNAAEPLRSRFLFHQGSLELGTILKSNLKNADLAFLSACQTSTGEEKLSDEAVHLAAGMLAAGYRRVVGTMWSIGDQPAQDVAVKFYEHIFTQMKRTGGVAFDGTHSAYALHDATQQLRLSLDDSERSLLTWVPFVHFGY
ncbi:CHAT domain-containing protein [Ephemerocybe angulata]|uniref:CHAT domain-containing protein n=1 Tax=Ephemerocybe angulata TaxID=980116 RepID=A0A8H6HG86_9AGAR|nr:CHAT domain-containing protein [Tulosesus angulatus]